LRLTAAKSILDRAMQRDFANERGKFAVESVFWRRVIDWSVRCLPAIFHRPLIWTAAFLFFFVAAPARRTLLRNLELIRPDWQRIANYLRVVHIFANFGWSLTDAAAYRILKPRFRYELEGARFLEHLATGKGGIVLTAHMGNYDLGAALFAERFHRGIKMVRAPEPDALAAQHIDLALQQSSGGAVQIGYSSEGTLLVFDLLHDLRNGEIISIQGDRVIGEIGRAPANFCGNRILLPNGPFALAFASETPIYPLFVVRTGYRKYRLIAGEPIVCHRGDRSREEIMTQAMEKWTRILEKILRSYWSQWFAFTPMR
jgi:lauroyl/myristoyl acyltransferase